MIGDWQACRRRAVLAADWLPGRWRPKALFAMCIRRGIMLLASTATPDPRAVSTELQAEYMETAADPGLDVYDRSPYHVARDYCALIDTVIHGLAHGPLPVLADHPPAPLNSTLEWRFTTPVDEAGRLHRFVVTDSWSNDSLTREVHSWRTIGDLVVSEAPLTIHAIVLGQSRHYRHHSAWARAFRHPSIPALRVRFQSKDPKGESLRAWKPVWFVEQPAGDAAEWVELASEEGAIAPLLPTFNVAVPPPTTCAKVRAELSVEGAKLREALVERDSTRWREWPMSRNACDGLIPCPYQTACYGDAVPLGAVGFIPRTMLAVKMEPVRPPVRPPAESEGTPPIRLASLRP